MIIESTSFYKIGYITAYNSPILKIQNLAYSWLRARSGECDGDVARGVICAMTSLTQIM